MALPLICRAAHAFEDGHLAVIVAIDAHAEVDLGGIGVGHEGFGNAQDRVGGGHFYSGKQGCAHGQKGRVKKKFDGQGRNGELFYLLGGFPVAQHAKEGLKNVTFVLPAEAGTQEILFLLDTRLHGYDDKFKASG